jgi:rhodanese-related sulfurtransferase
MAMITQIRPSQLAQWLESVRGHGHPVVIDVRELAELQVASIQADGFDLITIPMGVVPVRLSELNPELPIACLCHHGGRSMQVASFLKAQGFAHVANIAGGINAWSAELDPRIPRY